MSVPADTPAEVTYFPASTQRETLSHRTFGPCWVTQPKAEWLVAAGRPSRNPPLASTAAPVHTDAMIRTFLSIAVSQSRSAATPFGFSFSSSSGQVPAPPGTIRRSSGSWSAWVNAQFGTTDGPFELFTFSTSTPMSTTSNGYGGTVA